MLMVFTCLHNIVDICQAQMLQTKRNEPIKLLNLSIVLDGCSLNFIKFFLCH